jgi:iron(III) transport system permease protein
VVRTARGDTPAGRLGRAALKYLPLAALTLVVVYPLVSVLKQSFKDSDSGVWTLSNFANTFTDPDLIHVFRNTLVFAFSSLLIALVLATALALATTRLALPLPRRFMNMLPVVSLFIPPLLGALGWLFLFAPRTGLINTLARNYLGIDQLFNAYSVTSLILVGAIYLVPYLYLVLTAALTNMDSSFEEAAHVFGARNFRTLSQITLRGVFPSLVSAALLGFVVSMSEFSIPFVLGTPVKFQVVTTQIWIFISRYPVDYGSAASLGVVLFAVTILLTWIQGRALSRSAAKYWTVGGKGQNLGKTDIGPWKYLVAAGVMLYFLVAAILPILGLAYTAFQPYWGALKFDQLTLRNFNLILSNAQGQMDAVWNSTMLGAVGAAIGVLLGFAVSYVLVRTRSRGRRFVEAVAMAPGSIPHTLLGFGFLIVFLQLTQLPLYGTVWGLLTAYSILFLAHATRSMVGVMHQINPDLEEAARISGARRARTMVKVVAPLAISGLWSAWILLFALIFREVSASILLRSSDTNVVSTQLISIISSGGLFPQAAAYGCILLVANIGIIVLGELVMKFTVKR